MKFLSRAQVERIRQRYPPRNGGGADCHAGGSTTYSAGDPWESDCHRRCRAVDSKVAKRQRPFPDSRCGSVPDCSRAGTQAESYYDDGRNVIAYHTDQTGRPSPDGESGGPYSPGLRRAASSVGRWGQPNAHEEFLPPGRDYFVQENKLAQVLFPIRLRNFDV